MKSKPADAIRRLQGAGYVVKVKHLRMTNEVVEQRLAVSERRDPKYGIASPMKLSPRGGSTEVRITRGPGAAQEIAWDIALCSPYDNFNKDRGVRIALGRALESRPGLLAIAEKEEAHEA
jgi:hypothetical protein